MAIDDPNELERVDQEIRINELKAEAEELTEGEMVTFEADDAPPEILEQFWRNVVEYEKGEKTTSRIELEKAGMLLPPPDELDDRQLPAKLRDLFDRLADQSTYVYNTNHLSDRELYEELWHDALNEVHVAMPKMPGSGYFIDMLGSGSDEDTHLYMKYYADEEARRLWLEDFPDYEVPEHEEPPYDRDKGLPQPPPLPDGTQWC